MKLVTIDGINPTDSTRNKTSALKHFVHILAVTHIHFQPQPAG